MISPFTLSTIPEPLQWENTPLAWQVESGSLSITAAKETDWFIDPAGGYIKRNAPCALFIPEDEDFMLSAKVKVDFASAFDAGVLQIREQSDLWAKLCFEYSPKQQPMVVSVVTREVSDDCNSAVLQGNNVYLRIARNAGVYTFHYSENGCFWDLVRYFVLGRHDNVHIGFSAQSPTGKSCRAVFSEICYRAGVLEDIRSGE